MRRTWILACTLAEAVGIAGVAVLFAGASRGVLPSAPAILGAGVWEGLCLGLAQALVLRRSGLPVLPWVIVTMIIAVAGYSASLAFGAGGPDPAQPLPDPPLLLLIAGAATMGAGMGVLMGAAQGMIARGILSLAGWVRGNALGWTPAMVAIFLPATLIGADWTLGKVAIAGAASGALAGASLGFATSFFLPFSRSLAR